MTEITGFGDKERIIDGGRFREGATLLLEMEEDADDDAFESRLFTSLPLFFSFPFSLSLFISFSLCTFEHSGDGVGDLDLRAVSHAEVTAVDLSLSLKPSDFSAQSSDFELIVDRGRRRGRDDGTVEVAAPNG